jgi:hypothetical protein
MKRLIAILVVLPLIALAAEKLTKGGLLGTWTIHAIDGTPRGEKYVFNSDGSMLYVVGNFPRTFRYRLEKDELIIDRGGGVTLNRLIESFDGRELKLRDKDVGLRMLLRKEQ